MDAVHAVEVLPHSDEDVSTLTFLHLVTLRELHLALTLNTSLL